MYYTALKVIRNHHFPVNESLVLSKLGWLPLNLTISFIIFPCEVTAGSEYFTRCYNSLISPPSRTVLKQYRSAWRHYVGCDLRPARSDGASLAEELPLKSGLESQYINQPASESCSETFQAHKYSTFNNETHDDRHFIVINDSFICRISCAPVIYENSRAIIFVFYWEIITCSLKWS